MDILLQYIYNKWTLHYIYDCVTFQATVMKKRMYYNMRVKTVHRNMSDILSKMDVYKSKLEEFPYERIKGLYNVLKEVS